jgi:hypothetical protein
MSQYISDNTDDEVSHVAFLHAYLTSKGQRPVNFDRFRNLPSSAAPGAQKIGRLTNLMQLSVDTSWWTRYRSKENPDLGATFPQAVPSLSAGQHPAIPTSEADLKDANHIQAIANTAGFPLALSNRPAPVSTLRSVSAFRAEKCCESPSVSGDPRSCTSRSGMTRQVTPLH